MGVITLDDCARPKEQRATFHADIASRKLSIVKKEKKKSGRWQLLDAQLYAVLCIVYTKNSKDKERISRE